MSVNDLLQQADHPRHHPQSLDPVVRVDTALTFVGGRRLVTRNDVTVVADLMRAARCPETLPLADELRGWVESFGSSTTPAAPIIDALLDVRLALSRPVKAA